MDCPPCQGTGRRWGTLNSDCELCGGEGELPDTRVKFPQCHWCNGNGLRLGKLNNLCDKCGGWGRRIKGLIVDTELEVPAIIHIEAGKPWSAHESVSKLFNTLTGHVRICDPYYGPGTLTRLSELSQCDPIQVLTHKPGNSKDKSTFPDLVNSFRKEYGGKFEFRKYPADEIHDRFILTDDRMILMGHGLKDIGKKDSYVTSLGNSIAHDMIETTQQTFDERWE